MPIIVTGQYWRHHGGAVYIIRDLGRNIGGTKENISEVVIYKCTTSGQVWVRPLANFLEELSPGKNRFERI